MIAPIVEGKSEEAAIPTLLRRILAETADTYDLLAHRPFRIYRNRIRKPKEVERAVARVLKTRAETTGILLLIDADDDDPHELERLML